MTKSNFSAIFLLLLFIGAKSVSQTQSRHTHGEWSPIIEFEIVPVAVANLPDGRLVTWSSKYHDNFGGEDGYTYTQIFDPTLGTYGEVLPSMETDTNHDMFCPGINNLADGRIMVSGGSSAERTSIFDYKTGIWTRGANLNIPRGYQGAVTLSDGSAFTIGGSWSGDATYGGRDAELWKEGAGWTRLAEIPGEMLWNANDLAGEDEGEYRLDNHAWLWAAPNGKIFHAGPGEDMHWIDVETGSATFARKRGDDHMSMNGNTAMFDIGKLLKVGGSSSYSSTTPSNNNSYIIDINDDTNVKVTPTTNSLEKARSYVTSVVLPNGEVLILGGLDRAVVFWDRPWILTAEMFNPVTKSFRTLASMQVPRTYHSAGILLNDGRVFMGGGGLCGNCDDRNHKDAEIFSPPYLFDANGDLAARPTLSVPDKAYYETTMPVVASTDVTNFVFMRMSSATHSVNNEQRRVPVQHTGSNGNYILTMPNANLMPPGYYMLFAINGNGVPSISEAVLVGKTDSKIQGDNLVVEFDFFEGQGDHVSDVSGKNNHGTIKERDDDGSPVTPLSKSYWTTNGLSGNALEMEGVEHLSNTIVEIPSSESLRGLTNQITVMAWVNRNTGSVVPEAGGKIPNVSIFAHDYPYSFFMGYHDSQFKAEFKTTTGGHFNAYTGVIYAPGEWEHLVTTYNGSVAKVYVNGEEIFSQVVTGNLRITNDDEPFSTFTVSGFYDRRTQNGGLPGYANASGITDALDGRMAKFKLFNVGLTEQEIKDIYANEVDVVLNSGPCDDVALAFEVNDQGKKRAKEISVIEGDDVSLYLDPEILDYTITGPNGVLPNNTIQDMGLIDSGEYTVSYILKETALARNVTLEGVSSAEQKYARPGTNAIDGNTSTMWHTSWTPSSTLHPHYIDLDLGEEQLVAGLEYLPRQDIKNGLLETNGIIENYEIYVTNSTSDWGDPVSVNTWGFDQTLKRDESFIKNGRYVRLKTLANPQNPTNVWASAAEIRIVTAVTTDCEKTIKINVQKPQNYVYENGWQPNDPSGISRPIDNLEIISGDAEIWTNTLINNITVNPGASLTIKENVIMTYKTVNLNSTSTSFASLIDEGWMASGVNYNRYVNKMGTAAGGGNDLISSPVTGVVIDAGFVTANSQLAGHPDDNGIFAFAPYNVTSGKYENFTLGADREGKNPLVTGSGYRVATTDGSPLTFKGQITRNAVTIAISDAVKGRAWNLIGNPYPSYMDVEQFFTLHNIDQFNSEYVAIYGYTGIKDSWKTYNRATTNTLIAPGQGFFVKAKSGGGVIQFTPAMRRTGSSDDFILGRQQNANKELSKLKLSNISQNATTSIYFIEGTTRGLDPGYDAAAYAATAVNFSIFTNLLKDNTGLDISIQSLPYNDFNDVIVPLGIKAKAGEELTISLDELSTLPSNINVYLEDTQNKTLVLLNNDAFKFTPKAVINGTGRFNVHYSSRTLSVEDLESNDNLRIYTTLIPKNLVVNGQLTAATTLNLYDIQGRVVLSEELSPNSNENIIDISSISTGVYVVKIVNKNQVKTQKVLIR